MNFIIREFTKHHPVTRRTGGKLEKQRNVNPAIVKNKAAIEKVSEVITDKSSN